MLSPSVVLRATYVFVRGSLRMRTIAIVQSALFAARLPPLFNLCLTVLRDDSGNGFTPHNAASDALLLSRSGLSPAPDNRTAAVCGPTPNRPRNCGSYF